MNCFTLQLIALLLAAMCRWPHKCPTPPFALSQHSGVMKRGPQCRATRCLTTEGVASEGDHMGVGRAHRIFFNNKNALTSSTDVK